MRRASVHIAILGATCALAACGKDTEPLADNGDDTATQAPTKTTTTTPKPVVAPRRTKDGCAPVAVAEPRTADAKLSKRKLNRKLRWVATMRTNCGTISIKLDVVNFPRTTRSFAGLARSGFYDGLSFHRIAKPGGNNFVIQGGDPLGTGEGGPGYSVVESPKRTQVYRVGTVAMAKAGDEDPGASGSQFFVVTGQADVLDPVYAVIGRVISGGTVVRRIAAVPADPVTEMPIDPVIIEKVTVRSTRP